MKRNQSLDRCRSRIRSRAMLWLFPLVILIVPIIANAQDQSSNETKQRERIVTTRRVLVRSTSLLVRAAVVEDKLLKNSQFKQMGFAITRDPRDADFVIELRHDLFTMYVFTVVDAK